MFSPFLRNYCILWGRKSRYLTILLELILQPPGFSGEKCVDDVDRYGEAIIEYKGVDKDPVTWMDREDKRATDSLVEEDVSTTALEVTTTVFSLDSEDETGINGDSELEGISDCDLGDCKTEESGCQLKFSELESLVEPKT